MVQTVHTNINETNARKNHAILRNTTKKILSLTSQPSFMSAQQPGGKSLHEKSDTVSLPLGSFRLLRLLPILKKDQLSEVLVVSKDLRCTTKGCGGPPRGDPDRGDPGRDAPGEAVALNLSSEPDA